MPLTPDAIFATATVPPPDPAWMQPTVRGPMPVPPQPFPVPTAAHLAPQASACPGLPAVWGRAAQLPPGGPPPTPAQLPPGGLTPAAGPHLPVLLLLPGGPHPGTAPPTAPAPRSGHPLPAGDVPSGEQGRWGEPCLGAAPQVGAAAPVSAAPQLGSGPRVAAEPGLGAAPRVGAALPVPRQLVAQGRQRPEVPGGRQWGQGRVGVVPASVRGRWAASRRGPVAAQSQ